MSITGERVAAWASMEHPRREIEVETVQSAARRLGVCPKTVRRMISDGRLPAYRLGPRMLRLDPADVDRLLQRAS